ncbi:2-hydroxyacid dehydrogenase [Cryptococcus wingfieldii CBS 7118]|uniref:2-hydroxyacid dehydrogenase n=1 Tax=Cryptococcus wingfieldii CBS 7118 TaxID=1295528 RepID=A0A1E3HH52_9TREE|nr:2-hydroxyacid dehydrogenase [Cryptococcus wingfieldii CBS 7118]ODN75680.1 2-hydroxyacid dehydrogenase [Cryptococcus wingfieldii CBS 7118]
MTLARGSKVLFLDSIKLAKTQLAAFQKVATVVPNTSTTREQFISDLGTKYKDVSGIYRHFKASESIKITGRFDQELVSKLPRSLKFIAHNGAGYDQIDIPACTTRNVQVSNVPTAVDGATADTAIFLILSVLRHFPLALAHAQAGTFNSALPLSNDPKGKVLGIVGMGGIGSALAVRAKALGMQVVYHNRKRVDAGKEKELDVRYVGSLEELLKTSDVISLNLPLTPSTHHLISTPQFDLLKPTAVLINTARGPIIDETALIQALKDNKLAGVGLDVYENEPKIPKELLDDPRAVCLPHVGTVTVETQEEMEAVCLRNLETGLRTGKMGFVVAEQKQLLEE